MPRWKIMARGTVQGVGFRPFVARLAQELGLIGYVMNTGAGVLLEVEGAVKALEVFWARFPIELPPLAQVDQLTREEMEEQGGEIFRIASSCTEGVGYTAVAPDTAPCAACIAEMKTLGERRYQYMFTNCTHCGPRYTIIQSMPYDRQRTSMHTFPLCEACQKEYTTVTDRRYHAEPIACPACGPQYYLQYQVPHLIRNESLSDTEQVKAWIREGYIAAVQGVGGYHLVCDAGCATAVQTLRKRKHRPAKPFALMVGSLEKLHTLCEISEVEAEVLQSPARPIVLLRRKSEADAYVVDRVAPDTYYLGCMLPYSPFHLAWMDPEDVFVMTSANASGNPMIYTQTAAEALLPMYADMVLGHNRPIVAPLEDSIAMVVEDEPRLLRRARGYVPQAITLDMPRLTQLPSMLAMGSDLKNAFALTRDRDVWVGPYGGDIEYPAQQENILHNIQRFQELFATRPSMVVADSHPGYASHRLGRQLAEEKGLPFYTVQHHHAHVASVMAEHGITDPVLGIALDGTGYGSDGAAWGGEFLRCTPVDFTRLGHFTYRPLPGGEKAVQEPWRMALWSLRQIYDNALPTVWRDWLAKLPKGWELLDQAMRSECFSMVPTSSVGRLFDVVGSWLGLGYIHTYEGQVAMMLEQLAEGYEGEVYPYHIRRYSGQPVELDCMPTLEAIAFAVAQGEDRRHIAASWHRTVAEAIAKLGQALVSEEGLRHVVLSGGVWQNRRLYTELRRAWPTRELLLPYKLPIHDGGLALGQIWITWHRIQERR